MDSGMIGKIQKAKEYAEEPERITIKSFEASFAGKNDTHHLSYIDGSWNCSCNYFQGHGVCSHTMALERLLGPMIKNKQSVNDA